MAGNVVLGYDGSDGARAALTVAVGVARAYDAPLSIVFGYEPNPMGGETADYKSTLEKLGEEMVAGAVAAAHDADATVVVETLVVPMRPVESLLEAALERQARVIVVGSSGDRPLIGAILGSVPHKLLHRATVPVLVVPTPDD